MVITLSDSKNKYYFQVLPEKINYSGAAYFREHNILNKGPVKHPNGKELTVVSWESFFPGYKLMQQPYVNRSHNSMGPSLNHKKMVYWKDKGTKLKLNITGTPINMYVYIEKYEAVEQGSYGTINYSIEFVEAVDIVVTTTSKKVVKTNTKPRTSTQSSKKTHTVKSGDNLWKIARKYYGGSGSTWKKIYDANKSTIEAAAKKHGKKSSDNGHWIYPGTVLTIP